MQSFKDIINYDNKKKRCIEKKNMHFIFWIKIESIWFCSTVPQYKPKVTNSY